MEESKGNLVVLSLGSNMGDREAYLRNAIVMLSDAVGKPHAISSIYETPPLGFTAEQTFYNCIAIFHTLLTPEALLNRIHDIERKNNRDRSTLGRTNQPYASRTLDVDIVYFSNLILATDQLIVPHPRRLERKFVLAPLVEIRPDWIDPEAKESVEVLLAHVSDTSFLKKITDF